MKKYLRLIALLLVAFIALSLVACGDSDEYSAGDGSEVVMRYGEYTISEKDYMYILSSFKSQMVDYYQYSFSQYGVSYSESDILALQLSEETTLAQYIEEISVEFAQQMLIFEKLCADAGITITDQKDIDTMNGYMNDVEYAYGGEDLFEIELARLGISRTAIERYLRSEIYYGLIHDYRYGDNGVAKISSEMVHKNFLENYLRYDGALYSYIDYESGEEYAFEYSDDEIQKYFDENYVKVRHILYKTVDSSNNKLSADKIAEKKAKAEAALSAVTSEGKTLEDLKSETEDSGYEYTFTYDQMVENFEKAAFEMEIGEIRLVETEYGYHIIEKIEKTESDLIGTTNDEGKTTGGCKDDVVFSMTSAEIRDEALVTLEKLKNGEISKYPEEDDKKEYYIVMEPSLISKSESNYATFIEMVSSIEEGDYGEKNFLGDATYIIRRLSMSADDITSDIYPAIEDNLALTAFGEYVQSFYDEIEINQDIIDKFDVVTAPMLDSTLYKFG